jgi:hypothetical protein
MGYVWVHEGFEEEEVWGTTRTPGAVSSVTHLSVQWRANNLTSQLTTSSGAAVEGNWGVYSNPHGSYSTGSGCTVPGACGDGLAAGTLATFHGVAGWVRGMHGSKIALFLNEDLGTPVEFPEVCDSFGENCVDYGLLTVGQARFFGLIEPAGFSSFELREMEGTAEDAKYVWFDDFTVAFTNPPQPRIAAVSLTSNVVTMTVRDLAVAGGYTLEHTTSLSTNGWAAAQTFTASRSETNLSEPIGIDSVQRFYRLRSP